MPRTLLDALLARGYLLTMAVATALYAVFVYAPVRLVRWLRDRTWP